MARNVAGNKQKHFEEEIFDVRSHGIFDASAHGTAIEFCESRTLATPNAFRKKDIRSQLSIPIVNTTGVAYRDQNNDGCGEDDDVLKSEAIDDCIKNVINHDCRIGDDNSVNEDDEYDDILSAYTCLNEMPATALLSLCSDCKESKNWNVLRTYLNTDSEGGKPAETLVEMSCTPLHSICQHEPPVDVVMFFIENAQYTVKCSDKFGWLPLHYACFNGGSDEVLLALVNAYPESVTVRDEKGRIPLHFLQIPRKDVTHHHLETWRVLSSGGASACADIEGMLPLHYGCGMGIQLDVCAILVESYPEGVITIDIHGRTPLHILCANLSFSMPNIMKLLIETDPLVVDIANNNGLLPLHLLGYQAAKIPANDSQDFRMTANTYLDYYISAKPQATTELITALHGLPNWLVDRAVANPFVQSLLNDRISQRLHTSILLLDFVALIFLIFFFRMCVYEYIVKCMDEGSTEKRKDSQHVYCRPTGTLFAAITLGIAYFITREVMQYVSLRSLRMSGTYFSDAQNTLDLCSILLVATLTIMMWCNFLGGYWFRIITAVCTLVLHIRLISFLRSSLIEFAVFVSGVIHVLRRLTAFFVVWACFIIMSSQIFITLYQNDAQCIENGKMITMESELYPFCKPEGYLALVRVFTMMLGAASEETFRGNRGAEVFFVIFMLVMVIFLSTILIVFVTEAYNMIRNEQSTVVFWSSRLQFVAEVDSIASFRWKEKIRSCLRGSNHISYVKLEDNQYRGTVLITKQEKKLAEWWDFLKEQAFDEQQQPSFSMSFFIVSSVKFFLIIAVIPMWLLIGLFTMGWFWPPQVREFLLVQQSQRINSLWVRSGEAVEVHHEIQKFEEEVKAKIEEKEMAASELNEEFMKEVIRIKENVAGLLDLSAIRRELQKTQ